MSAPAAGSSAAAAVGAGSKRPLPGAVENSGRRMQPRHFHFGPNPTAGAASSAESAGPPPAARLYRHALESIFRFLNQRDLTTALRVSKDWLAAVQSMATLQLTVEQTSAPLCEVAGSVMGRHVTQLGSEGKSVSLTADSLCILARHMVHLRVLFGKIELAPPQRWLTFPRGLQKLNLRITGAGVAASVNAAFRCMGSLHELDNLAIFVPAIEEQLSFAPLSSMPLLRHLSIFAPDDAVLSDAHVAQLRALPLLRRLDVRPISTPLLRRMLAQPHDLQWQQISLPETLGDEVAALLPQLPSLTQLDEPTMVASCSRFDFLRQLPQLTNVVLILIGPDAAGRIDSLIDGLQCCTHIEGLTLCSSQLTSAHLDELLPRLPRLHTLYLARTNITTLAFLAQPPMTDQLASFQMLDCVSLPLTDLRRVHALRALKKLILDRSFDEPMDSRSQSLYTPPSLLLPQLQVFSYRQFL